MSASGDLAVWMSSCCSASGAIRTSSCSSQSHSVGSHSWSAASTASPMPYVALPSTTAPMGAPTASSMICAVASSEPLSTAMTLPGRVVSAARERRESASQESAFRATRTAVTVAPAGTSAICSGSASTQLQSSAVVSVMRSLDRRKVSLRDRSAYTTPLTGPWAHERCVPQPTRDWEAGASDSALLEAAALSLTQTAPDAEPLVVGQGVLEALRPDVARATDLLGLTGRAPLLREECLGIRLSAQGPLLPAQCAFVGIVADLPHLLHVALPASYCHHLG